MKIEDYREGLTKIDQVAKEARARLAFEYAVSNNPYKTGDIVTDKHGTSILIEKADVRISSNTNDGHGVPTCVYYGPVLKKDGTPRKDGKYEEIWQTNV